MTGDLEHLLAESLRESVSDLTTYSRLEAMQVQGGGLAGLTVGIVVRPTVTSCTARGCSADGTTGGAEC